MLRKIATIIIMEMLLITPLFACSQYSDDSQAQEVIESEVPIFDEIDYETQIIYDIDDVPNGYCKVYESNLIYKNEELGYAVSLPISWEDHFRVVKNSKNSLVFFFWGGSDIGYMPSEGKYVGLYLFSIVPENALVGATLDSVTYIGMLNGINYYYATHTDCEICALKEELDDYENGISTYQDDSAQIELIRVDYEIARKMREDFDYQNLNFQPLE